MVSHISIAARTFILVVCTGLVAAGCRTLQGPKAKEPDTFGIKSRVQRELEQWHELKQKMIGEEPARPKAIEVSVASTPSVPAKLIDTQSLNHTQKTELQAAAPKKDVPPRGDVVLRPGDVVEVKFFYTPELDVTQTVRPDGKITFQLVGEVTVEGKTPRQVTDNLYVLYRAHLKNPQIAVLVKSLYDRRVFVGGQVTRPGTIDMPGEMTVMEAIMAAGGFDMQEAEVESVIVIRQEGNRWQGYKLNMKPALRGDTTQPFFLCPKDVVYVPRTKIAEVDQWIEEHISKLIPRLPFYFSVPLGQ